MKYCFTFFLCVLFFNAKLSSQATYLWNGNSATHFFNIGSTNASMGVISKSNESSSQPLHSSVNSSPNPYPGGSSGSGGDNFLLYTVSGGFNSASSSYFEFTVTPNAGYLVQIESMFFGATRTTSNGPTGIDVRTNGSGDNYMTSIGSGTISNNSWNDYTLNFATPNLIASKSAMNTSITVRIYFYGGSVADSIRMDDLAVTVKSQVCDLSMASGTNSGLTAQCMDGNWTYYGNGSGNYFGIDKTGTTGLTGETVTITIDASNFKSSSTSGPNEEHGSVFMKRSWDVAASAFTGSAKVRFFYDASDSSDVISERDSDSASTKSGNPSALLVNSPFAWFKSVGLPYASWRTTNVDGNKFTPSTFKVLTPSAYGTLNGHNYVEFVGITSFSGGTGGAGFGPPSGGTVGLPVTWAGFDVKTVETGNELNWKTASEWNTDYFQVEYSYDAKNFVTLPEKIKAAGNSADLREYSMNHLDFSSYVYYRIVQYDLDGQFSRSEVVLAKRTAQPTFTVDVYPVPMKSDNLINVRLLSIDKSTVSIKLMDMTGKVMRDKRIVPASDAISEPIDMSPLSPGLYFVEVENGQGKETIKVSR